MCATSPLVKTTIATFHGQTTEFQSCPQGPMVNRRVRITYPFGPPSPPPAEAAGGESSVVGLKNGSRS